MTRSASAMSVRIRSESDCHAATIWSCCSTEIFWIRRFRKHEDRDVADAVVVELDVDRVVVR